MLDDEARLEVVREAWGHFLERPVTLKLLEQGYYDPVIEELYVPEVEWDMSAFEGWPEETSYQGRAGVKRFFTQWFGAFEEVTFEVEGYWAGPGETAATIAVQRGIARGGLHVENRFGQLFTFADEHVSRVQLYSDPDAALRAIAAQPEREPAE